MSGTLKPRDTKDVEAAVQWAVAEGKALELVGQGSKRAQKCLLSQIFDFGTASQHARQEREDGPFVAHDECAKSHGISGLTAGERAPIDLPRTGIGLLRRHAHGGHHRSGCTRSERKGSPAKVEESTGEGRGPRAH